MKMKVMSIPVVALALSACQPLKGPLQVTEHFRAITKENKVVVVSRGNYDSEFKYDDRKREVEIKIKNLNGRDEKMKFKVPNSVHIPTTGGTFAIRGTDIDQEFDLTGRVGFQVNDSELRRTLDSCSYSIPDRVCEVRRVCPDSRPGRPRRPCRNENFCRTTYRTIFGRQEVEYFVRSTFQSIDVNFAQGRRALARLAADRNSTETITTHRSRCY